MPTRNCPKNSNLSFRGEKSQKNLINMRLNDACAF